MGLKKFGRGEILPESEQEQKTASQHWTDEDAQALAEENAQADGAER